MHARQIVLPSRSYELNKVGWEQDGTEMGSHTPKKEKVQKIRNQRSIGAGAEVGDRPLWPSVVLPGRECEKNLVNSTGAVHQLSKTTS